MKTKNQKLFLIFSAMSFVLLSAMTLFAQTANDTANQNAAASVAVVLVGDGEGVVVRLAPAVAIKSDGVLLVPYHVLKDAKQVQVRLKTGEIFDDVALLGSDERRDVAASS